MVRKTPSPFGARLRTERERRGLTQKQLASTVGCSQKHLSRLESGHVRPYLDTVQRLAETLGVSLARLCG